MGVCAHAWWRSGQSSLQEIGNMEVKGDNHCATERGKVGAVVGALRHSPRPVNLQQPAIIVLGL